MYFRINGFIYLRRNYDKLLVGVESYNFVYKIHRKFPIIYIAETLNIRKNWTEMNSTYTNN